MQHRSYPTRPGTPTPPAVPPAALHLVHGIWIASCPDCGHELGRSRDQEAAERTGQRRRCPICRPGSAIYRLLCRQTRIRSATACTRR